MLGEVSAQLTATVPQPAEKISLFDRRNYGKADESIAYWSGMLLMATLAILRNLRNRGYLDVEKN